MKEREFARFLSGRFRFVVSREQLSADLAGEAAILNLKSGTYYGLDKVGARIWSLLSEPKTFQEIRDAILAEYEVQSERCEAELSTFLQQLAKEGLVEIES